MKSPVHLLFLVVPFCFSIQLFAQQEENLLVHYELNNDFTDSSPNGYDGVGENGIFVEDYLGNPESALSANGIDTYVDFPELDELEPSFPITVAIRAKFDVLDATQVLLTTDYSINHHSGVWIQSGSNGNLSAAFGNGQSGFNSFGRRNRNTFNTFEPDTWYSIVAVFNGPDDIDIYVDCELQDGFYSGTANDIGYTSQPGSLCRKRANPEAILPPYYFEGDVDEFMMWDAELTEEEITSVCMGMEFDCPDQMANIGDACEIEGEAGTINESCDCIPNDGCAGFEYYLADVNEDESTILYALDVNESAASLSQLTVFETERHIAYNSNNGLVYSVQKSDGAFQTYNPDDGTVGPLVSLEYDLDEVIGAAFNDAGQLLLLSQSLNAIFAIDVESGSIDVYDSYAPVLGGDIEVGPEGDVFLATREDFGVLYLAVPDFESEDILLGDAPQFVSGIANSEDGQLLLSAKGSTSLTRLATDGSAQGTIELELNGETFVCGNGDLAAGCSATPDVETSAPVANNRLIPFPNPAASHVGLDVEIEASEEVEITATSMTDLSRKVLFKKQLSKGNHKLNLDVQTLPDGIYILRLESPTKIESAKLIISR